MKVFVSKLNVICLITGLFFYTTPAYAYLDPGTGSMLIQGLIAGIATMLSVLSIYWQKVKSFFVKEDTDSDTDSDSDSDTYTDSDTEKKD
jgi:hypothetical protein